MLRSFTLLLLLAVMTSSCIDLYKLTVSSDAYAIQGSDKFHSQKIFVDPRVTENDLSKLPFLQKLKQGLARQGIAIVESVEESDLVLSFDVAVQDPLTQTYSGTKEGSSTKTSNTKTNPDGTSETIEVTTPGQDRPYSYQYHTFEKVLTLKLRTRLGNQLVWQSKSIVEDEKKSYGPYTDPLVYTAITNFLRNTTEHPKKFEIGQSEKRYIEQLLAQEN